MIQARFRCKSALFILDFQRNHVGIADIGNIVFKAAADLVKGSNAGFRYHIAERAVAALVAQLGRLDVVSDIVLVVQMPARLLARLDAVEGDFGGLVVDQNFVVAQLVFRYFRDILFFELLGYGVVLSRLSTLGPDA